MNENTYSSILCRLCGQPVDLTLDAVADERGQTVHELCYVKQTTAPKYKSETPDHKRARSSLSPRPAVFYAARCR